MENPIKMDDLGVPLILETPTFQHQFLSSPRVGFGAEVPTLKKRKKKQNTDAVMHSAQNHEGLKEIP